MKAQKAGLQRSEARSPEGGIRVEDIGEDLEDRLMRELLLPPTCDFLDMMVDDFLFEEVIEVSAF